MKKLVIISMVAISSILTGCSTQQENRSTSKEHIAERIPMVESKPVEESTPIENEVDYSDCFKGVNGCAVFYDVDQNTFSIYNKDLINEQISPYSTFKIVNALMGLSKGVVTTADTQLGYDGNIYWKKEWNKDITFEEAFKESCVWYFEKIMYALDKAYVQKTLNELNYGNSNLSVWNEEGHNSFWLSSSLKISPMQQVKVLTSIFEEKTAFRYEHVELIKSFMLIEENEEYAIYGKTGSGKHTQAWFVGFMEKDNRNTYFAVNINDENQELPGALAKEITLDIIKNYYHY